MFRRDSRCVVAAPRRPGLDFYHSSIQPLAIHVGYTLDKLGLVCLCYSSFDSYWFLVNYTLLSLGSLWLFVYVIARNHHFE